MFLRSVTTPLTSPQQRHFLLRFQFGRGVYELWGFISHIPLHYGSFQLLFHYPYKPPIYYSSFHLIFHYPNITPTLNHKPQGVLGFRDLELQALQGPALRLKLLFQGDLGRLLLLDLVCLGQLGLNGGTRRSYSVDRLQHINLEDEIDYRC